MKILLIGGAGLIGSKLENILHDNGHETLVLDNFTGSNREFSDIKGQTITGNASSFSVLNNVFSWFQPRAVFHLADSVLDKDNSYFFELEADTCVNVATNLLRCISLYAVEFVFFGSSSEVYKGNSKRAIKETAITGNFSYTGATKNYVEGMFRLNSHIYDYKFNTLRYFGAYGDRYFLNPKHDVISFWVDSLLNSRPVAIVGANSHLDMMSVDDAAKITYNIFDSVVDGVEVRVINIGSGKPVKLLDLYKKVSTLVHGEIIKPFVVKPGPQNRTLIADTKKMISVGGKISTGLEETLNEIIKFRRDIDGR